MPLPPRAAALAGVAAVAVGLGAGAWFLLSGPAGDDRFAACRQGGVTVAAGPSVIGGPFEMTDHTGRVVTEADVITGPTLVYFGYTHCPDICPWDVARNAEAIEILEERGVEATPVFVTIDPARDDQATLADFVENMHPRMIGLRGTPEQTRAMAQAWKVYYAKVGDDPQDYLMDHLTYAYLMAPEEGFLDLIRRETTPEEAADRIQCFAERL